MIMTVLIFSSILIIHTTRKMMLPVFILLFIFMVLSVVTSLNEASGNLQMTFFYFLFIYFSFISYYLVKDVTYAKSVTSSVIFGAFAGYFLIGVLFFFIFALLDASYPDTLNIDLSSKDGEALHHTLYFSFVTLTTIGYGDYAPTSILGQKIAILEGLIGQFYIATVMATIVGKFLTRESARENR
jgi:voltage-gated potassium channel